MVFLFISAFVVGLSGAMMPGPLLTYTIQKSLTTGWKAGFIITAGHAVLELILVIVIFLGFDLVLRSNQAQIAIGIVGGILLVYMGFSMILNSYRNNINIQKQDGSAGSKNMFLSGIVISLSNPYFLLWWAIIGLGFIMQSYDSYGVSGATVFYFGHISADFIWYGLISIVIGSTRKFIKEAPYRIIIAILGGLLIFFGFKFVIGALASLLQMI